jgi:hypothetical protein
MRPFGLAAACNLGLLRFDHSAHCLPDVDELYLPFLPVPGLE